jgi:tRNA (cytidine/uridine-2'-O-)-methyltransferase
MWPKAERARAPFHGQIVLVAPEIPGNTGSIGRTCLALNMRLILIHPLGFELSEKSVRRAGLDYWKHLNVVEYQNFDHFLECEKDFMLAQSSKCYFFTRFAEKTYFEADFKFCDYLIFGSEGRGLSESVLSTGPKENQLALPMFHSELRSLNLANAVTAVAYEVTRQIIF